MHTMKKLNEVNGEKHHFFHWAFQPGGGGTWVYGVTFVVHRWSSLTLLPWVENSYVELLFYFVMPNPAEFVKRAPSVVCFGVIGVVFPDIIQGNAVWGSAAKSGLNSHGGSFAGALVDDKRMESFRSMWCVRKVRKHATPTSMVTFDS